jgi:hypothetical protein
MADSPRPEDRVLDGAEPTEEVGPSEAEASADAAEVAAGAMAGNAPEDSEFSLRSEIDEAFPVETIPVAIDPVDGLPTPVDDATRLALAAPFTVDTVVCLEDDSEWVEVFKEELEPFESYEHGFGRIPEVLRGRLACRAQFDAEGVERERSRFEPKNVSVRWGHHVALAGDGSLSIADDLRVEAKVTGIVFMLVRPKRVRCDYYKRQVFVNDDVPNPADVGHKIIFRNCGARRSVGGALMSLRDEGIYACDYRSPPDPTTSERYLDGPDRAHVRSNAHLKHLPLFNLTGEEHDRTPPNGGRVRVLNEREPNAEG